MRKIGLLVLALVLALGGLGIGYAAWTDQVTITQTVQTGNVEVGIRDVGTDDNTGDGDGVLNASPSDFDPGWQSGAAFVYDKDVAHTESVNIDYYFTKVIDDVATDYYHAVSDTLYNAYPSYAPTIVWEITNNGSIPVRLQLSLGVTPPLGTGLDPFVDVVAWTAYPEGLSSVSGINWTPLLTYLEGYQLHPCEELRVELTKHIRQEHPDGGGAVCPQNATVTYTLTVNAIQWNEYP